MSTNLTARAEDESEPFGERHRILSALATAHGYAQLLDRFLAKPTMDPKRVRQTSVALRAQLLRLERVLHDDLGL